MGRPPGIRRRVLPGGDDKNATMPESPQKETFPRRFPRLGSQFQTKLPKSTDPLERPIPEPMSVDYPHLTEQEAQSDVYEENVATAASSSEAACRPNHEISTKRGGLLLHTPSDDMDSFPRYVQPLMAPLNDDPPAHLTNDAWKQHMVRLHNNETPRKKRSRAPRGGKKRKRVPTDDGNDDDDDLIWSLEDLVQRRQHHVGAELLPLDASMGEDEARAIEYLHRRHDGNTDAAKMNLMVDLSAGRATKIRKCIAKRRLTQKTKLPPPSTSESWRKKYESMRFPSIFANFEDDDHALYGVNKLECNSNHESGQTNLASERDDLKGVWRSVLACGKAMECNLEGEASSRKLLLSTVVSFISNAFGLPTPESCFGTHHVLIEEVSTCLLKILVHVENARQAQAKLRDRLFKDSGDGIDSEALLKFLDSESKLLSIRLDDAAQLYESRKIVIEWEERVSALVESNTDEASLEYRDDLKTAEDLVYEARSHGYTSKVLVQLKARVQKSHGLRHRIDEWKESCRMEKKGTIKTVAALVRESNRVKLVFPEVAELLSFHQKAEGWVDRANVAIRSRISLREIEDLIDRGEEMPLDLSDYVEKLRARVATAVEWTADLEEIVPIQPKPEGNPDWLDWLSRVRIRLNDGMHSRLHDLASEGSRIPVEVDAVKLLQVELDAKHWTQKAKKWIPKGSDSRRGKLPEIRDHVDKAHTLRERLALPEPEREGWILDGETELRGIVFAADSWYEKYKEFLEGDNRRKRSRTCLSINKLRQIVNEMNAIHVNIGNAGLKIARILAQAEAWYAEHRTLLERCNAALSGQESPLPCVNLTDLTKAVESAESDVSLDLDEAVHLKEMTQSAKSWLDRVDIAAPKRSKRQGRMARAKLTIDEITTLLKEASSLPVDTKDGVARLQLRLRSVETWQGNAANELVKVATCFDQLREHLNLGFGMPKEFRLDRKFNEDDQVMEDVKSGDSGGDMEIDEAKDARSCPDDTLSQSDSLSTAESDSDCGTQLLLDKNNLNVHKMIKDLQKGAKSHGVLTQEAEAAEILDSVSHWCLRSFKYLSSPREVFDKRFFGAFDRFIKEGNELAEKSRDHWNNTFGKESWNDLGARWGGIIVDQLERLEILRAEREKYMEWCNLANQILNDEKKLTLEKLEGLAEQSRCFPAVSDMVQKVRGFSVKAKAWAEKVRTVLDSGTKLSLQDGKSLLEAGEKLKVNSQEIRTLRASLRAARGWTNRVKRCNLELGSVHVSNVRDLIEEYDTFLIEMPDELARLQAATQSYCVCRRPYNGFMIGCDECEDWYHGPCIGVSESRADRFDKYVCIRCSVKNIFKNNASSAVRIVRKWTSRSEKKKARQVDYQKHQRKVRKETKDIEKFRGEIANLKTILETGPVDIAPSNPEVTDANASDGNETSQPTEGIAPPIDVIVDREKTQAKLDATTKALKDAENRLDALQKANTERKRTENLEDWKAESIRRWCIRVRSLVLVPATKELADRARPLPQGDLSAPMLSLITDATSLGVFGLPDVDTMVNFLKCMSWSLFALSVIRRKATLAELQLVLSKASPLRLSDEKPVRTIKIMIQRAVQWQGKVKRALAPKPGQTKPLSVEMLKGLLLSVEDSAVHIPEVMQLKSTIADKGARHCICGGPNYGGFMLCCDKCELWFHGACVGTAKDSESLEKWLCAACRGVEFPPLPENIENGQYTPDIPEHTTHKRDVSRDLDCSPHAPQPAKLWPPFRLTDGKTMIEILGAECASYPDDCDPLPSPLVPPGKDTLTETSNPKTNMRGRVADEKNGGYISKPMHIPPFAAVKPVNQSTGPLDVRGVVASSQWRNGSVHSAASRGEKSQLSLIEQNSKEEAISRYIAMKDASASNATDFSVKKPAFQIAYATSQRTSRSSLEVPRSLSPAVPPNPQNANSIRVQHGFGQIISKTHEAKCKELSSVDKNTRDVDPSTRPRPGLLTSSTNGSQANFDQSSIAQKPVGIDESVEVSDRLLVTGEVPTTLVKSTPLASPKHHLQACENQTGPAQHSKSSAYSRSTGTQDEDTRAIRSVSETTPTCASGAEALVTGMPMKALKKDDSSSVKLYTSCQSSKSHADALLVSAEKNVTVTPSPSVQIFDSEVEMSNDRARSACPEGPNDRSVEGNLVPTPDICFEGASARAEGSQSLSRPLADMRVALKEASA